ncbi:nonstructural protein [Microviridae sp.]|nr:nonstructural protein [Microviridae sp.]
MNRLYVFFDKLAGCVVGHGVHLFKHDAAAIRFFGDVASDPKTSIAKHVKDYQLLFVGAMDEQGSIELPESGLPQLILDGEKWLLSQPSAESTPTVVR